MESNNKWQFSRLHKIKKFLTAKYKKKINIPFNIITFYVIQKGKRERKGKKIEKEIIRVMQKRFSKYEYSKFFKVQFIKSSKEIFFFF